MDWLDLLAVQGTLKSRLQHHSLKESFLRHSAFFIVQLSHLYMTTGKTIVLRTQDILHPGKMGPLETLSKRPCGLHFRQLFSLPLSHSGDSGGWLGSPRAWSRWPRPGCFWRRWKNEQIPDPFVFFLSLSLHPGFPGDSYGKEPTCNAGDLGSFRGLGRSPGEGNGNQFQYSCLENSMDQGAWWATVHGVAKSWTGLSN